MHRLNLTVDEALYDKARAFSFMTKKPISQLVRESLTEYLSKNGGKNIDLLLDAKDEKKILDILKEDNFTSQNDFKKEFNL